MALARQAQDKGKITTRKPTVIDRASLNEPITFVNLQLKTNADYGRRSLGTFLYRGLRGWRYSKGVLVSCYCVFPLRGVSEHAPAVQPEEEACATAWLYGGCKMGGGVEGVIFLLVYFGF